MSDNATFNQDSGSFLTGFTVGLFAGAAGYFLFRTDRGHKIRQQLAKEWQDAQFEFANTGVVEKAEESIGGFFKKLLDESESNSPRQDAATKKSSSSRAAKKVSTASRSTKRAKNHPATTTRFKNT